MGQAKLLDILACNTEESKEYRPCKGKGTISSTAKETISIPKGVDNGVNLRVAKKGHSSITGTAGDLMIAVKVKAHPYFKRDSFDILTDLYLTVS